VVVALGAVVVCDAEEVVVPEFLEEDLGLVLSDHFRVLLDWRLAFTLSLGQLVVGILYAVTFRDVVVLEVHVEEVRDVDDLTHGVVEGLSDVEQVEAVHLALDRLDLALLLVDLV